MNNYYIRSDGKGGFINHPIVESNLKLQYPSHDFTSGPPDGFYIFERVPPPPLGPYEGWDSTYSGEMNDAWGHIGSEYKLIDGKVKDVWHTVSFTEEEKKEKQDSVKAYWISEYGPNWSSWTFDEINCCHQPPTAKPDDGKLYLWDEASTSWKEPS